MKATDVNAFIAIQDKELQSMLHQLRAIIKGIAPGAVEQISYMVPCYKLHGMFIGFGVHKGGCSLYAMNTAILKEFAGELEQKGIRVAGSTLHFSAGTKLPVTLLKRIIKRRLQMNLDRAAAKTHAAAKKSSRKKL